MFEVLACGIVPILFHSIASLIKHGPDPQVADTSGREIQRSVCLTKVELGVSPVEIAFLTGES